MSPRPLLLDLFCGAGGAAVGYHRAGFAVIGVDIKAQPNYPFPMVQADALDFLTWARLGSVAAIHASPPCQDHSRLNPAAINHDTGWLLAATRELLGQLGIPWILENVDGSGLPEQPDLFGAHGLTLCNAMFGLKTYRHRLFESSSPLAALDHPRHDLPASKAGHWRPGTYISVSGNCAPINLARQAMGVDWTTRDELAESIPPAFTEYVGTQILAIL